MEIWNDSLAHLQHLETYSNLAHASLTDIGSDNLTKIKGSDPKLVELLDQFLQIRKACDGLEEIVYFIRGEKHPGSRKLNPSDNAPPEGLDFDLELLEDPDLSLQAVYDPNEKPRLSDVSATDQLGSSTSTIQSGFGDPAVFFDGLEHVLMPEMIGKSFKTHVWDFESTMTGDRLLRLPLLKRSTYLSAFVKKSNSRNPRQTELAVLPANRPVEVILVPNMMSIVTRLFMEKYGPQLLKKIPAHHLALMLLCSMLFYNIPELAREADTEFGARTVLFPVVAYLLSWLIRDKENRTVSHYFRSGTSQGKEGKWDKSTYPQGSSIPDLELQPRRSNVEVKPYHALNKDTEAEMWAIDADDMAALRDSPNGYVFPINWPKEEKKNKEKNKEKKKKIPMCAHALLQCATQIAQRPLIEMGVMTSVDTSAFCVIPNKSKKTMYVSRVHDGIDDRDNGLEPIRILTAFFAIASDDELKTEFIKELENMPKVDFSKSLSPMARTASRDGDGDDLKLVETCNKLEAGNFWKARVQEERDRKAGKNVKGAAVKGPPAAKETVKNTVGKPKPKRGGIGKAGGKS